MLRHNKKYPFSYKFHVEWPTHKHKKVLNYKNTRNSSFGHICHNLLITIFQLRQLAKNIMLDFNFS